MAIQAPIRVSTQPQFHILQALLPRRALMKGTAIAQPCKAAPAAAACRPAARRSPATLVRAQQQQRQQPQQQQGQAPAAAAIDRRALLAGVGAAALALASDGRPALAAGFPECDFQTAPSGLQWCDVVEGSGDAPVQGARIRAHYSGRLVSNGVQFDSSYERGRPLVFQVGVGQVIKGWDAGILGADGLPPMKPGGKRRLIIPPELGYGERGAGGVIPPGAQLDFIVEYLGIQGKR